MSASGDPRPLTSEPLPLDLVNTVWIESGTPHDLLADERGLRLWLDAHGFDVPANGRVRAALVEAREAMRSFLTEPMDPAARAQLDAVLVRHRRRRARRQQRAEHATLPDVLVVRRRCR